MVLLVTLEDYPFQGLKEQNRKGHLYNYYVSPLQGSGDILFFSLRLSVTKSCQLYNLITVTDISMKLHTFVKHIETTCHAQEP